MRWSTEGMERGQRKVRRAERSGCHFKETRRQRKE